MNEPTRRCSPFDVALRSFGATMLQGREHNSIGLNSGEYCGSSAVLLRRPGPSSTPGDFVERRRYRRPQHVPTLERGDQTLLDVSQKLRRSLLPLISIGATIPVDGSQRQTSPFPNIP